MPDPGFVHLHVHSSYSLLEGALTIGKLAELRQGGPSARARAHRHRQHVRGARILRQARQRRHPADHRLRALRRFRRPGSASSRPWAEAAARGAARGARRRLPQSHGADVAGLPRRGCRPAAARQAGCARKGGRWLDRADRRPGRPTRSRARSRAGGLGQRRAARGFPRCSAAGSTSSCSATAGRKKSRSSPACSSLPMRTASRSSRPTSRSTAGARISRRTMP